MATSKKASKTRKKTSATKASARKKSPAREKAAAGKTPAKKASAKKKAARSGDSTKTAARKPAKVKAARAERVEPRTAAGRPEQPKKVKPKKTPAIVRSGLRRIKEALLEKRQLLFEQLQSELKEMERPEKRYRADLEEIASDTHDSDSLCQIMDINASQMDQIDAALKKIEESTYGICEDCDEEIPLPRLEALPFATQCIECKRKAELSEIRPTEYYSAGIE